MEIFGLLPDAAILRLSDLYACRQASESPAKPLKGLAERPNMKPMLEKGTKAQCV
jgi:hypothetical protein